MTQFQIHLLLVIAYHSFICFFMKPFFRSFDVFEFFLGFYLKMSHHFALTSYFIGALEVLELLFVLFSFSLFSKSLYQSVKSLFVSFSTILSIFFFPFPFILKFKIPIRFGFSFWSEQVQYLLHLVPSLLLTNLLCLFVLNITYKYTWFWIIFSYDSHFLEFFINFFATNKFAEISWLSNTKN